MSEKAFFYTIIGINVLLYILAFGLAHIKKQGMTFYTILLAIESFLVLFWIVSNIQPQGASRGDAAGSGMAEGFYWLIMLAILIIFILTLATTIVIKLNSPTVWKCLIATPFAIGAFYLIYSIDYRNIYFKLLPVTDESSLVVHDDGLSYDSKGKLFTGTAKAHGLDENFKDACISTNSCIAFNDPPWRIAHYENGNLEGLITYYAKARKTELGILWLTRTRYFGFMHAKQGRADGEAVWNIPDDYAYHEDYQSGYNPCYKELYDNGKLICKQWLFELEDEWKENGILQKPTWLDLQKQEKCPPADEIKENKTIEDNENTDELKPDSADTYINMGYAYFNTKDYKKAIECYEKAIELKSDTLELAYWNMGLAYGALGYDKKAKECIKKVLEIKCDKEIANYENDIKLNPNNVVAYANMGNMYADKDDYEKAIECYKKAIEIDPTFRDVYNNMGDAYKALGNQVKANECYKKAK